VQTRVKGYSPAELGNFISIPGFERSIKNTVIESPVLGLFGPPGSGKTMYCRQFLLEGQSSKEYCILLSSDMTEKQFLALFSNAPSFEPTFFQFLPISTIVSSKVDRSRYLLEDYPEAQNSSGSHRDDGDSKDLLLLLDRIQQTISSIRQSKANTQGLHNAPSVVEDLEKPRIRLVFDSVSYLEHFFADRTVIKFVTVLLSLLREEAVSGVFTFPVAANANAGREGVANSVSTMLDGIIETKLAEEKDSPSRSIRLFSLRGHPNTPTKWVGFKIGDNGQLKFEDPRSDTISKPCTLCGKPIKGDALMYQDNPFDTASCMDTYKKLSSVYGPSISPSVGLPSDVVNLHFFFIDIVGLSDPSLSVKRQLEKIAALNTLVRSCSAFKGVPKDKKIVLPTGDGMAIGFLQSAEHPLRLSIELHKLLKSHNERMDVDEKLGARIGIGSGHVFIHNDINDNQNVWGPGIIMARRVMDLGDNLHILIEGNTAKGLMDLKDEYRMYIKELSDYKIKHGQTLKIFSAYSDDFGNPALPAKLEGK
jgi:KaiC/GvpD/RAD55 family RecA-like ATPase